MTDGHEPDAQREPGHGGADGNAAVKENHGPHGRHGQMDLTAKANKAQKESIFLMRLCGRYFVSVVRG